MAPRLMGIPSIEAQNSWTMERLSPWPPAICAMVELSLGPYPVRYSWGSTALLAFATRARGPVQDEMSHFHPDFRQLDELMGVIGHRIVEVLVAARTTLGFQMLCFAGLKHDLPMTFVALLCAGPLRWRVIRFLLKWGVRGWRLVGVG